MAPSHGDVVGQIGVRFLFGLAARGTVVANHWSCSCGADSQENSFLILLLCVPLRKMKNARTATSCSALQAASLGPKDHPTDLQDLAVFLESQPQLISKSTNRIGISAFLIHLAPSSDFGSRRVIHGHHFAGF